MQTLLQETQFFCKIWGGEKIKNYIPVSPGAFFLVVDPD
jgi:hypothetical protein